MKILTMMKKAKIKIRAQPMGKIKRGQSQVQLIKIAAT